MAEEERTINGALVDIDTLTQDDHNFNKGTEAGKKLMKKSFEQFGAGRSILVDKDNRIIAGNKSRMAAIEAGIKKVRVIETTGDELIAVKRTDIELDSKEGRELALADNLTTQVNLNWDEVEFARVSEDVEGFEVSDWGLELNMAQMDVDGGLNDVVESRRREFEKRIEAGEAVEGDEDYKDFVKKFEIKKTTDDCYTPDEVYDVVADYVSEQYGLSRSNFVRPFYPGGDYEKYEYKKDDVVVDNPPFSILSKILRFYLERNISFWLFAPTLTLFSVDENEKICYAITGVHIRYKNNALVNTSFITNLENGIIIKSEPELYKRITEAQKEMQIKKQTPKYRYPANLITASMVYPLNRYGIKLEIMANEVKRVEKLDCQGDKAIFGSGFLISERARAEKERAEKERAEKENVTVWQLSEREKEIVKKLG